LEQSFTARMPSLKATSAFRLGRRRYSSPQQCYLHCLHVIYHCRKSTTIDITCSKICYIYQTHSLLWLISDTKIKRIKWQLLKYENNNTSKMRHALWTHSLLTISVPSIFLATVSVNEHTWNGTTLRDCTRHSKTNKPLKLQFISDITSHQQQIENIFTATIYTKTARKLK